jgi:molecular chaperone DnaK
MTHAVGIDLGTTYSCISYLNPQGEPVTLPNAEGEFCTPSVVLFDGDDVIVGTEALRNSISQPDRVVENAKRFMGDANKVWMIDGIAHRPHDIASFVLKKLLAGAEQRLGPIRHAVITVPAQFSEAQRQATIAAGRLAGLEKIDIINEPVAAALCHVLGEGNWFAELANDQLVMVFDLGGGTFDLSLVQYNKNSVKVVASGGDLHLGGIDWNKALAKYACDQFAKVSHDDPRVDRETMQALAIEVEQTKRSLSVRPRASITLQHAGKRKLFPIDQDFFESLTADLVKRCRGITTGMLKDRKIGWHQIHAVLVTGGATRMPMIRKMLKEVSGTTLNDTLSPDQSIAHGAAFYAGMLMTGNKFGPSSLNAEASAKLARVKQQSANARALGIIVRDKATGTRLPHYLLPKDSALPAAFRQRFGTVVADQRRVHLRIVESGTSPEDPFVELGSCIVDDLPRELPEGTPIEVTIRYDEQACVHVEARELNSGKSARTSIIRQENLQVKATEDVAPVVEAPAVATQKIASVPPVGLQSTFRPAGEGIPIKPQRPRVRASVSQPSATIESAAKSRQSLPGVRSLDDAEQPVPLCNECGEPLNHKGQCVACMKSATAAPAAAGATQSRPVSAPGRISAPKPAQPGAATKVAQGKVPQRPAGGQMVQRPLPAAAARPTSVPNKPPAKAQLPAAPPVDDAEIIDLTAPTESMPAIREPAVPPMTKKVRKPIPPKKTADSSDPVIKAGEDEFWNWAGPK